MTIKIALIVSGISMILFFIVMPYPFTVGSYVKPIINVKSKNVERILIGPLKTISMDKDKCLIKKTKNIADVKQIRDICTQLNTAKKYHVSNSRRKWYCRIALVTKNEEYVFTVRRSYTDGTLIYIGSRGEWGYHAIYRSDELGMLLETIAKGRYVNG
jgi:hypothetical protein